MGTTADKLARLNETKVSIKTAINDPTLGDKFADYPTSITNGKAYIAQKITEKGVEASGSDTFQQLGDKVGEIKSGGLKFNIKNNYAELSKPPSSAYEGEYVSFKSGNALFEIISESGNEIPFLSSSGFGEKTINFVMPSENITINPK